MGTGLFGIKSSNRDFSFSDSWGKNQFNSSFPAALLCYMQHKEINSIYIKYNKKKHIEQDSLSTNDIFGMKWDSPNIFFGFEQEYVPYGEVLVGKSYPIDLVIKNLSSNKYIRALEIKLTALPDTTTCNLAEENYGAEIVVRTPTIAYIAASICLFFKGKRHILRTILSTELDTISNWENTHEVLLKLSEMIAVLKNVCIEMENSQTPLIVQPIWKTKGKSSLLEDNCLDVFVWSDIAFLFLLLERISTKEFTAQSVSRPIRTIIWITKMLYDFNQNGLVNAGLLMDKLSYGPKNDKAISLSGKITSKYLKGDTIICPRITKYDIKNIIHGDGVKFLSPERRFDSSIVNDPDLYAHS